MGREFLLMIDMPPAARNLFVKRFLDFQKLLLTKALVKIFVKNTHIFKKSRQACQVSPNLYANFITLAAKPLNKSFWPHLFSKRWVAEGTNIGDKICH
jgi:hypothetical protein